MGVQALAGNGLWGNRHLVRHGPSQVLKVVVGQVGAGIQLDEGANVSNGSGANLIRHISEPGHEDAGEELLHGGLQLLHLPVAPVHGRLEGCNAAGYMAYLQHRQQPV